MHTVRTSCRLCARGGLLPVLSFGATPLANSYPRSLAECAAEPRFPLTLAFCEGCSLLQLEDAIDPAALFRDYVYVTATSDAMAEHNARYAAQVVERLRLARADLVVEIASNDGSLLRRFRAHGVRVLGVEPAAAIAATARAAGIETLPEFFTADVAARIARAHGPARAVVASNVLAHVGDPVGFLRDAKSLLAPGGVVLVEVHWAGAVLDGLEYDTIYHEHLCYWTARTAARACAAAGLRLADIELLPVHGGSLRLWAEREEDRAEHDARVLALIADEEERGFASPERYRRFAADVARHRDELTAMAAELRAAGRTLAAYGAPAKACTLLAWCGLGRDAFPFTVDKNPRKVGAYLPGSHVPVLPVEALLQRQPDHALLLSWNWADEIVRQQSEYRRRGGKFVLPFPSPRIV
jgi:SAM-dependent methyltransferase